MDYVLQRPDTLINRRRFTTTRLSLATTVLFFISGNQQSHANLIRGSTVSLVQHSPGQRLCGYGRHCQGAASSMAIWQRARHLRGVALGLIKKASQKELLDATMLLRKSARLFTITHSDSEAGADYISLGEVYFIRSRYQLALSMYQRALHLSHRSNTTLRCSALTHIAVTRAAFGDHVLSLQFSQQAVNLAAQIHNSHVQGEAFEALGEVLAYTDAPEKALNPLQSAKEIFEEHGDAEGQARTALNTGFVHYKTGNLQEALSDYQNALQRSTSVDDVHGAAQARAAMGLLWTTIGEPDKAYDEYREARRIFHTIGDLDNEGVTLNGLGGISKELGAYDESLEYYQQARTVFVTVKDRLGELGAIDGAALAEWALRDYPKAEWLWRTQLRRARLLKNYHVQAAALSQLGNVYHHEKIYTRAKLYYDRALALCRLFHHALVEADVLIQLGHLYAEEGKYDRALDTLHSAMESAKSEAELAKTHFELAFVHESLSDLTQARRDSEEAVAAIESQRTKISDFGSRATYFASVHQYYQLYIDVLMQLDEQHPDQGFAAMALEASEKSKVRSLLDMLANSSAKLQCDGGNKAPMADLPDQKPPSKDCNTTPTALTLQQIQAAIQGDDAVLLEYALGPEASYLWAIDDGRMSSYRLPGAQEILDLTTRFQSALLARQMKPKEDADRHNQRVERADKVIDSIKQELSQVLLGPASSFLRRRRIIIIPDGPLQSIPFAALPLPSDVIETNGQMLMNKHELTSLPSASVLSLLRDAVAKRITPTKKAAVFADPVFSRDDPRLQKSFLVNTAPSQSSLALGAALRDTQFGSKRIPRLPSSGTEANNIAELFASEDVFVALGFNASRNTVLSTDLRLYRYIHFATHGMLDTKNPEFSGLILSLWNQNGEPQEGYLRLRDIYNLELSADLVVLSSCNSALGKDLESEGIIGLPRAFLYAGSQRVISTLWKVDDEAAAEFMTRFYSRLHADQNPASALRGAQSDMANSLNWRHPFYWAAFVLQGEYR